MTRQYVYGAAVVVFAVGMAAAQPAKAQRRDGNLLPQEQSGQVTTVGCLLPGSAVRGGKGQTYVLAHPKKPVASVPEATCTADPSADALDLDNEKKAGLNDSMLGRWVEVTGRLEKETSKDPDNLRELDVESFRIVPVVPPVARTEPAPPPAARAAAPAPRVAEAAPTPRVAEAAPTPRPPLPTPPAVEVRNLPHTASDLPLMALAALLALAGGVLLRSLRLRQRN